MRDLLPRQSLLIQLAACYRNAMLLSVGLIDCYHQQFYGKIIGLKTDHQQNEVFCMGADYVCVSVLDHPAWRCYKHPQLIS